MRSIVGVLLLMGTALVTANNVDSDNSLLGVDRGIVTCTLCRTVMNQAMEWINAGDSREELIDKFTAVCMDVGLSFDVCRGVTELNIDIVLWIMEEKNDTAHPLTPREACGFALYPDCNLSGEQFEWTLDLSSFGAKPTPQVPVPPPNGSPTLKVLQITDVHVDPMYQPGGNAACGDPTCCRSNQAPPANESDAAGYWGDYRNCDLPTYTFENMLKHANATHPDVSYVMFTGDIVDHAVWSTSVDYNTNITTWVMDRIYHYFPGVQVLPILGNHESNPTNVFSDAYPGSNIPPELTSQWLYELLVTLWRLPPYTEQSILQGGFYAFDFPRTQLKVVVMNSMFCYNYNWWLMYDNVDPSGQLMWLAGELKAAEDANKKVHILMHHPSGNSDCMHQWSSQYRRIIDRFENTVVAQFHGHTHNDHFSIYYDLADRDRATNVAFTAGSGTSYSDVNMNYRVYTVDGHHPQSSYRVLDHETWFFNLTEANLAGQSVEPNWQKLYSFNEAYGVPNVLPMEMDALVRRMIEDPVLKEQYFRYYVKLGDPELEAGCNARCLNDLMCRILTTVTGDDSKCRQYIP